MPRLVMDWLDLDWMLTKRLQCHPTPQPTTPATPQFLKRPFVSAAFSVFKVQDCLS